jgi:hypothetical protein
VKKLTIVLLLVVLFGFQLPSAKAELAIPDGEGLYPFTRRNMPINYGQIVELRVLDDADKVPGNFGWLSWNGSGSSADLAASLAPPGNSPTTYFNPGNPDNGWTPNYDDHVITIGKWVQGMPGEVNADDVRIWLDWHIAHKTPMVIPLYDTVYGQGTNAYYRIASFAAFEIQSYDFSGKDPSITGKFLRWVTNGSW